MASINGDSGIITSPGYPSGLYNSNLNCQWIIRRAISTTNTTFFIHDMQTENGTDVLTASSFVHDHQLASTSGNISNAIFFTTSITAIKLLFSTNNQTRYNGFNITFSLGKVIRQLIPLKYALCIRLIKSILFLPSLYIPSKLTHEDLQGLLQPDLVYI